LSPYHHCAIITIPCQYFPHPLSLSSNPCSAWFVSTMEDLMGFHGKRDTNLLGRVQRVSLFVEVAITLAGF
jgi:hypothetical protein